MTSGRKRVEGPRASGGGARSGRWWGVVGLFSLALLSCEGRPEDAVVPPSSPTVPPANVVLITLDTLRADRLGCHGAVRGATPNLDRLAAAGVRFTLATTVSNNTLPSHAAMLTGRYPHDIGVPRNGYPLPRRHPTLATRLAAAGYDTAAFVSASALAAGLGLDRGFGLYDDSFDVSELDQDQRRAETTTDRVLEWLETRGPEPFFLWVHYFDPHYPYSPPPPYDTMFVGDSPSDADGSIEYLSGIGGVRGFPKRPTTAADLDKVTALYEGEIAYLDVHLGRVLEALGASGLGDRTGVVVVADHGESLTEHDYFFDHGLLVYQPSMHVPLIVRPPGRAGPPQRQVVTTPVQTLDVHATVLGLAGEPVTEAGPGRDLATLWSGSATWAPRLSFGEGCRPWAVEARYPGLWPNAGKWQFVLDFPWKLVIAPYLERGGLYHLGDDPEEVDDLSREHPEVTQRLWDELRRWRESASGSVSTLDEENAERLRALGYVE